ncbi:hypothetical protein WJ92_33065 [Burkholderia ubonensis]|nr:hypothetical protein WJ92_33065 [Burkholderia ubonensis]
MLSFACTEVIDDTELPINDYDIVATVHQIHCMQKALTLDRNHNYVFAIFANVAEKLLRQWIISQFEFSIVLR